MQYIKTIKIDFNVEKISYNEIGESLIRIKFKEPIKSNNSESPDIEYMNFETFNLLDVPCYDNTTINDEEYFNIEDYHLLSILFNDLDNLKKSLNPYFQYFAEENKIPPTFMNTDGWSINEIYNVSDLLDNTVYSGILNSDSNEQLHVTWNYNLEDNKLYIESKFLSKSYDLDLKLQQDDFYTTIGKILIDFNKEWNEKSIGNFEW